MWEGQPLQALTVGGGGQEDRFTHGLAALLRDRATAAAFLSRRCGVEVPEGTTIEVVTQLGVGRGRADLILRTAGAYVLLEMKAGADLHGAQMSAYARHVAAELGGRLFLVAPAGDLERLAEEAERELRSQADLVDMHLGRISWLEVEQFCKDEAATAADPRLRFYLADFAELIHSRLETVPEPFTPEQITLLRLQDLPGIAERIDWLIARIAGLVASSKRIKTNSSAGQGFSGWWLQEGGHQIWLGTMTAAWRRWGLTPIWLLYQGRVLHEWNPRARACGWPAKRTREGNIETLVPILVDEPGDLTDVADRLAARVGVYMSAMIELAGGSSPSALPD
jgi:hypothetical protein